MKNKLLATAFISLSLWSLFTSLRRDPGNPPISTSGAPAENNCGACHTGGNYTGKVEIDGIPTTVTPNKAYTITLTNTSNAVRSGFQVTCIDGSDAKCGTFTNGTGTSIANSNLLNRQYIRQSAFKTLTNGSTSWTFTWTAPATAVIA
jgi:hypothetical protein